jgi:hypothetical protein
MIMRLLICAAFALYGTEAHARGGQAGNGAIALAVLLSIIVAMPWSSDTRGNGSSALTFANQNRKTVVDPSSTVPSTKTANRAANRDNRSAFVSS